MDSSDSRRRRFLKYLVAFTGGIGATLASVPFFWSLRRPRSIDPSNDPVRIDITKMKAGQIFSVVAFGQLVYVLKRSPEEVAFLGEPNPRLRDPNSVESDQPDESRNPWRSIRPDIFVAYGECTHLGCAVAYSGNIEEQPIWGEWEGGYFGCPCHGSSYDLAGRVAKNGPAPRNLRVPRYEYIDENTIEILRPI